MTMLDDRDRLLLDTIRALTKANEEIARLREALEHVTELLVDTWHTVMEGDAEKQVAVKDARGILRLGQGLTDI